MAPYSGTITVRTNEDWSGSLAFTTVDPGDSEATIPLDLTGCTFDMQLRMKPEAKSVFATLSTANERLFVTDPATGILAIQVVDGEIELHPGIYAFDLRMKKDGLTRVVAAGDFIVIQGVTRP